MAAANIENFSVCRFVISVFLLSNPSGPTSTRVPDVVAGYFASAVPVQKSPKMGMFAGQKCENVQRLTENVIAAKRHKKAQHSLLKKGKEEVSDVDRGE